MPLPWRRPLSFATSSATSARLCSSPDSIDDPQGVTHQARVDSILHRIGIIGAGQGRLSDGVPHRIGVTHAELRAR